MPAAPLPPDLVAFLAKPHPAVVGTVRSDGMPVTTPCWYKLLEDGRVMLSMTDDSHRVRHLRNDPRIADIPVLIISASLSNRDVQTWLGMPNVADALIKPFDINALLGRIEAICEGHVAQVGA